MDSRKLVVIYLNTPGGAEIVATEDQDFYPALQVLVGNGVRLAKAKCSTPKDIIDVINEHIDPKEGIDKLFLHFSGHGSPSGFPYEDFMLKNSALGTLIDQRNIEFCFFSTCHSGGLVEIVNGRNIPVVVGTAGDNQIENSFAIKFQLSFYRALLQQNKSYNQSFEAALVEVGEGDRNKFSNKVLVRGEAADGDEEAALNALQIAYVDKEFGATFMSPPDFLREMHHLVHFGDANQDPVVCVNWFNDEQLELAFSRAYLDKGFDQQLEYVQIEQKDLNLLNDRDRHGDDPFGLARSRLLVHCATPQILPPAICDFVLDDTLATMDHCKALFLLKSGVTTTDLFVDNTFVRKIRDDQIYHYTDSVVELFDNDDFIKALDDNPINFGARKAIALNFDCKPMKSELIEIEAASNTAGVFFARVLNARLIRFLINYIKLKYQLISPPTFVIDNSVVESMDFFEALKNNLEHHYNSTNLISNVANLLDSGGFIVFVDHQDDTRENNKAISKVIDKIGMVAEDEKGDDAKIFVFCLSVQGAALNTPVVDRVFTKKFSPPAIVNREMLELWRDTYSVNPLLTNARAQKAIFDEVSRISETIKPEKFEDCCPSAVVARICDEIRIPRKQIIG